MKLDDTALARRRSRAAAMLTIAAFMLTVLGLAFGTLWSRGWLPGVFAPRKLVVRGCELTSPDDVIGQMDLSGRQAVPAIWARSRKLRSDERKWLEAASVSSAWGRVAMLDITERKPLLLVVAGEVQYWLCDDGRLVPREPADSGPVFQQILSLPRVALADDPGAGRLAGSDNLLTIAAACSKFLPGQIAKIDVSRDSAVTLYDLGGFPILLGQPMRLTERIAALPKALRICEGHKASLRYLDATDTTTPLVFYQKWRGPARDLMPK